METEEINKALDKAIENIIRICVDDESKINMLSCLFFRVLRKTDEIKQRIKGD